ncbi:MAG: TAT-variant-translocated molybdopterin oxidoreductase [Phycisphaerales bacterium JB038]
MNLNNTGQAYWRSLDELADTAEFREFLLNEFPNYSSAEMLLGSSSRRRFLKIMGASLAMGGLVGCRRWPERKVSPYASRADGHIPGQTEQFATVMEVAGTAKPLLVTSFDGRPIKIEGNPEHPASNGAADVFSQASILGLYDPERARHPSKLVDEARVESTWQEFDALAQARFAELRSSGGQGLAVLSESSSSPTFAAAKVRFLAAFPNAMWAEYEPSSWLAQVEGARLAFGRPLRTHLHLEQAEVIVSLDADLLGSHPNALKHARDWAVGRRSADDGRMNRLYAVEGAHSLTGANADARLALKPSRLGEFAQALLATLQGESNSIAADMASFVASVAADLRSHRGRSLVVAGAGQPAAVHAICFAINEALGNIGQALTLTDITCDVPGPHTIDDLTAAIRDESVSTLVVLGGNPVYDAPANLDFAAALELVSFSVQLSEYVNETARRCTWHLPRAHYLEAWGDARSWDGTISVVQPLIRPLYDGRSNIELLAGLLGEATTAGYDLVRESFRRRLSGDFQKAWRRVLHDGLLADSQLRAVQPTLGFQAGDLPAASGGYDVVFLPDSKVHDGRFANNGWLQELPDALTLLTWDNAALVGPSTAEKLGVDTGDMINITVDGCTLEVAVFVMPGTAADTIALSLGYGRTAAGHVGNEVGFNAYSLRTTASLGFATGAAVAKSGNRYQLVSTQNHHAMQPGTLREMYNERIGDLVREAELDVYRHDPQFAHHGGHGNVELQLFEDPVNYDEGHKWGMAIDLTSCIGCNSCIVACQAENNIPIVGKEQVRRGREMHWLRVDRYFKGESESPQVVHQPLTCHHCENAPCEQVCPVAATVHDTEGLNVMIYNRCIGTRYCSNNCPYKVRRFNYFDYHTRDARSEVNDTMPHVGIPDTELRDGVNPLTQLGFNPDVTVRMRGVMEKCTYCTQRIQAAKITAKNEQAQGKRDSHRVADGEITPACAQTCPTQAIVFGDLNDPESRVHQMHQHNRAYGMLEELNVRPRTKYLAKVRNAGESASTSTNDHRTEA